MALEDAIKDLTAAIEKQTALIESGVAKAGGTTTAAKKTTAAAKKTTTAAKKPAAKPKNPTEEALREKFGGYLTSVEDKAGKRELTATVKPILEHFGVDRVTEIAAENRAEAIGYADLLIEGFEEGGIEGAQAVHLPFMQEEEGEEGDDVL